MSVLISPSVLSCDFGNIQRDVEMINNSEADWFHIDIMDGVFVPNISFGFPVLSAIKNLLSYSNDMVTDAGPLVELSRQISNKNTFEWIGLLNHTGQLGNGFQQPVSLTVDEGATASFSLGVLGDPAPVITWYRGASVVGR